MLPHSISAVLTLASAGSEVPDVALYWALPFVALLGCIAVMPLVAGHFWHKNYPYVSAALGALTAIYYLVFLTVDGEHAPARHAWLHEMQEYVSFIALLGSLFIISGGIKIDIRRRAVPITNVLVLLIGAVAANVFGTTGAAMLLIRPFIRINKAHIKAYHVVFFIFLVANCGGSLTPIGDPPLFMGYLKGVPFWWVLEACWPMWITACGLLLIVFFVIDTMNARKFERAHPEDATGKSAVGISGLHNFLWIGLVLIAVFQEGVFETGFSLHALWSREVLMVLAIVGSRLMTRKEIYDANEFSYEPIREVALLFIGIFSTMVPALNWLYHNSEKMPLHSAVQYYFVTGSLSAVLDNAPTYLVFLETKRGNIDKHYEAELGAVRFVAEKRGKGETASDEEIETALKAHPAEPEAGDIKDSVAEVRAAVEYLEKFHPDELKRGQISDDEINLAFLIGHPIMGLYIVAISVGAVFFGSLTYIGNGPNFMVKSIAESSGVAMPSFFGYILRFSLTVALPIYIIVAVVFFILKLGV